jgi:homoserine dehydrogenase
VSAPIVVLKLGGSVLTGEDALATAVHEVYRHIRQGHRVLAVVSAMSGATDALLQRGRALDGEDAPHGLAPLLATGEAQATALLVLALERAGIPARAMEPHSVGLRADGPPMDATPYTIDADAFRRAFEFAPALVLPGFVARDAEGSRVLLGRGGSDLTALFSATALGAERCVLVKDVDGMYDRDPHTPGPAPRRFSHVGWQTALSLSGVILQEKAARFALDHRRPFEVMALGRNAGTSVGDYDDRFALEPAPTRPLRIGLLGLGTVGGGVLRRLTGCPTRFECIGAVVRDPRRPRDIAPPLVADVQALLAGRPHVIIEALGDVEPARTWVRQALEAGVHVISANKSLLAAHGPELTAVALANGVVLADSPAVGGAVPCMELTRAAAAHGVTHLEGVLNGTSTFVLDRVAEGDDLDHALSLARDAGLAEADATLDLDGTDAAQKLTLLARAAWGDNVTLEWTRSGGLTNLDEAWVRTEASRGRRVRLVARAQLNRRGARLALGLESLDPDDGMGRTRKAQCALRILRTDGALVSTIGRGAGRWPTAEAVMADVLLLERQRAEAHASLMHELGAAELR